MKICILHISDLHRDPANPIRNDVLLDSLENDWRRYSTVETSNVRSPDLIIVSGDIVYGIRPEDPDPENRLRKQYQEALDFLTRLTDRFMMGDRNRVIIVPGNHDVSAYHFKNSLRRVDILPDRKKELVTQLFSSGSPLRWSWSNFELYEIIDPSVYMQRFAAFVDFYTEFYNRERTYDLNPEKQVDIFDFPEFDLAIAGFSSCYNNDLFNKQGAIHPGCIAFAGEKLRASGLKNKLRIAVWHHNVEGLPMQSDFMDPDLIQNLIDRGFSLGLHGHQHRPQFLDTRFRHGIERKITIISAGTLCGGASFRYGRAYNVIEIDTDTFSGRLHIREMQNDNLSLPIWGRRSLPPNTSPYLEFVFDPPPEPAIHSNINTTALIEAQHLYDSGDFRRAVHILTTVAASDNLARPLLLESLVRLKDAPTLIASFDPPVSEAEAIHVINALWMEGRRDRLREVLQLRIVANSADPSVIEIREKFTARLSK